MERFNNRYKRDMKTAVEFLFGKIKKELGFTSIELEKIFEQAKEMEKEQIENAYKDGYNRVVKLIEDATQRNL